MNNIPVSCIMPTANRQHFLVNAINNFLIQDHTKKELIIIDDSQKPYVFNHLPNCIRYEKMAHSRMTIGEKRNIACDMARGEYIVHLDDDDWYAPDWISRQLQVITAANADIAGMKELLFYNPLLAKAWKYEYRVPEGYSHQHWLAGATMIYRKSLWKRQSFKHIMVGEDNDFVWRVHPDKVVCSDYLKGFVSLIHKDNTSPKHTWNPNWHPFPVEEVACITGSYWKNKI